MATPPLYIIDLQTGDILASSLDDMVKADILSTVLLTDGSNMIQQATRDQQKKKTLAKKAQAKLGLAADNDTDRFNKVGDSNAKSSNPWGAALKKTTTIQDIRGDVFFLDAASQQIGEVRLRDCVEGGVIEMEDKKFKNALQDEAKQEAINSHVGPMLHTLSGTGGQWVAQGAAHTKKLIGHTPAPPQISKANPSDQYSGSHTTHSQSTSGAKVVEGGELASTPSQKIVTFTNTGKDPTMKDAELYYENTRYGALGHNSNLQVASYEGHRWFIVSNGVYAKQYNVGPEANQTFEF